MDASLSDIWLDTTRLTPYWTFQRHSSVSPMRIINQIYPMHHSAHYSPTYFSKEKHATSNYWHISAPDSPNFHAESSPCLLVICLNTPKGDVVNFRTALLNWEKLFRARLTAARWKTSTHIKVISVPIFVCGWCFSVFFRMDNFWGSRVNWRTGGVSGCLNGGLGFGKSY